MFAFINVFPVNDYDYCTVFHDVPSDPPVRYIFDVALDCSYRSVRFSFHAIDPCLLLLAYILIKCNHHHNRLACTVSSSTISKSKANPLMTNLYQYHSVTLQHICHTRKNARSGLTFPSFFVFALHHQHNTTFDSIISIISGCPQVARNEPLPQALKSLSTRYCI